MSKGYWVCMVDVTDPDRYKPYTIANGEAFTKYGGRFLIRAAQHRTDVEGTARGRIVVIEFPSYEAALACYQSPEYQAAKALRTSASVGDIIVLSGYDGPQPGA